MFRRLRQIRCTRPDAIGTDCVIGIDPEARTADVAMCTYEDLIAATLHYGLSPLVVPRRITLGGAVTGWVSSRRRSATACPNESVLEMDII